MSAQADPTQQPLPDPEPEPETPIQPTVPFDFDPTEVVTTDKLETDVLGGKAMLNDYVRMKKIGGGQHGEVYLCFKYNTKIEKGKPGRRIRVAMKAVRRDNPRAEQLRRLRQQRLPASGGTTMGDRLNTTEAKIRKEIAIMKKLRHPHVVRLYEVIDDRQRDKIYMVMEYLGGGEVIWRNEHNQPVLSVAQSRRIIRDAVLGLEYLHHQGIIHRDIKPANLLWTTDRQRVKIADFGVSHFSYAQRLAAAGKNGEVLNDPEDPILLEDSDLTRRAGTPSFLAPEIVYEHTNDSSTSPILGSSSGHVDHQQILARRPPITKSIDVWALGVTLYCLLFGKTPFTADKAAHGTEWSLYNAICNSDWAVDDTMGSDRIPTMGRHPRSKDTSEGANVVRLLDHFLQKDMKHRITLEEVKSNVWILKGLNDPEGWLRITSPDAGRIHVSSKETSDAMGDVHFRWNWGALTKRVSSILRLRPQRAREPIEDDSAIRSESNVGLLRRQKSSAAPPALNDWNATYSPGQDKGKRKAGTPLVKRHDSKKLPVQAINKWANTQGHSNYATLPSSSSHLARDTETQTVASEPLGSSQSSPTSIEKGRSKLLTFFRRGSISPAPPRPSDAISLPNPKIKKADRRDRRSEEALKNFRSQSPFPAAVQSGGLTAARRASSWGHGDDSMEFAEVSSLMSADRMQLNEHDMNVGAGGLETEQKKQQPFGAVAVAAAAAAVTNLPRVSSKLATESPLIPSSEPAVENASDDEDDEFEDAEEFPVRPFDPETSTFESSDSSFEERRDVTADWQDGSDEEESRDDVPDSDDDDDNALTFSPAKAKRRDQ